MRDFLDSYFFSWKSALLVLTLWCAALPASAWIYPEHRDIALLAVEGLDTQQRAVFDRLWQEARMGGEERLCPQGADAGQGTTPECIDWAALSGIAGDHSCSSQNMLGNVLESDWILTVADVAAQLKKDLAGIPITVPAAQNELEGNTITVARERLVDEKYRAQRVNALRTADIRLQRADARYASRADANLAHFMLARPETMLDANEYGVLALRAGSDLNAAGVYAWFHISALRKAGRLSDAWLSSKERADLARTALFVRFPATRARR